MNQHGFIQPITFTPKASRKEILSILHNSFKNEMDNNGRLIIYFAGHGETYNKTHYLIPSDCQNIALDGIKTSEFILSLFDREDYVDLPKHILFIFDCCESSQIFEDNAVIQQIIEKRIPPRNKPMNTNEREKNYLQEPCIELLTSSWKNQESLETGNKNGLFTEYLVKGLQEEAFIKSNSFITTEDLHYWMKHKLPSNQIPSRLSIYNTTGSILFKLNM
jgi:hypothetical protein